MELMLTNGKGWSTMVSKKNFSKIYKIVDHITDRCDFFWKRLEEFCPDEFQTEALDNDIVSACREVLENIPKDKYFFFKVFKR